MDQPVEPSALTSVTAPINYLIDTGEKPVTNQSGSAVERTGEYQWHDMEICDGRPLRGQFSLDRDGFALVDHPTAVANFLDEEERRAVYHAEVEALVKRHSGASRVFVFDHTLRADAEATRAAKMINEPVRVAHNDYTDRSGPQPGARFAARRGRRSAVAPFRHHQCVAPDRPAGGDRAAGVMRCAHYRV